MRTIVAAFGVLVGIVVCALLLQQLIQNTLQKEGFADVEPEERISPEVFAYNLLQAVKGPIQRLGGQLTNMGTWKERFTLAQMTPVELARHQLIKGSK